MIEEREEDGEDERPEGFVAELEQEGGNHLEGRKEKTEKREGTHSK